MYSGDPPPVFNLAVCESRTMINPQVARSLAGAAPRSFWLDQPDAPEPLPALTGRVTADLAVVGGGFTGLWTALLARERDPSLDVVLLEARTAGWAASGRNGGFCSASLTHGLANGLERFPDEMPLLERLGAENLREIGETVAAYRIDCDFALTGELNLAIAPWQLDGLAGSWTPRCSPAGCGTPAATRWSNLAGWPGACAAPAWRRACGSTRTRLPGRWPGPAAVAPVSS
jgi:hypothetical protein